MKYFRLIKLRGNAATEEDLERILPPPWKIVPRCGAQGMSDQEPAVLVAVPITVTTPLEELERSLSAVLVAAMENRAGETAS